jgi:hypothetical protein
MPAASDWHVARLVFQSVSVLIAGSALKDGQMQLSPTAARITVPLAEPDADREPCAVWLPEGRRRATSPSML